MARVLDGAGIAATISRSGRGGAALAGKDPAGLAAVCRQLARLRSMSRQVKICGEVGIYSDLDYTAERELRVARLVASLNARDEIDGF